MSRHHCLTIPLLAVVLLAGSFATAHADDPACKPVLDAQMRQSRTAYRETIAFDGKPTAEKIYTSTAMYLGKGGQWMTVPMTPQERVDALREQGYSLSNCKQLRFEAVDGLPATVYAAHGQTTMPVQSFDAEIWIARSSGLILKVESDQQQGGRKTHVTDHFSYDNVQPPAAAK